MKTEETTTTTTNTKQNGSRPAKPGSSNSDTESSDTVTDNGSTTTNDTNQMPEEFDGQPPEMCDENDENCEMPELPEGMQGVSPGDDSFSGQTTGQDVSSDSVLHPVGYLALGGVSVIISMVIAYACFSKFFHKKPGQTFDKGSKFAWYIVTSLLLAAGLITLCYFIPIWTK